MDAQHPAVPVAAEPAALAIRLADSHVELGERYRAASADLQALGGLQQRVLVLEGEQEAAHNVPQLLQQLLGELQGIRNDVQAVRNDVQAVLNDVQAVQADLQALTGQVHQLQADQTRLPIRLFNSRASLTLSPVRLFPLNPQLLPGGMPRTLGGLRQLTDARVTNILGQYQLPQGGTLREKRRRLMEYLGVLE